METPTIVIESLIEKVEEYGKTTIELTKLKLLQSTTTIVTALLARLSVFFLITLFVLVLSIGIALLLGEMLGKSYYGFFVVSVLYLIAGIVCHFFLHKWIKSPVSDLIISHSHQ